VPAGVAVVLATVPVPSPLSVKVSPVGNELVGVQSITVALASTEVTVGRPLVVTGNVPAVPAKKLVESAEVKAGGPSTVKVKVWVASGLTPFEAVRHKVYVPAGVDVVVATVPIPSPKSVKDKPVGNGDSEQVASEALVIVGVGLPSTVTVKSPAVPVTKLVEAADEKDGGPSMVKRKI
jgi:hypothetical protein